MVGEVVDTTSHKTLVLNSVSVCMRKTEATIKFSNA